MCPGMMGKCAWHEFNLLTFKLILFVPAGSRRQIPVSFLRGIVLVNTKQTTKSLEHHRTEPRKRKQSQPTLPSSDSKLSRTKRLTIGFRLFRQASGNNCTSVQCGVPLNCNPNWHNESQKSVSTPSLLHCFRLLQLAFGPVPHYLGLRGSCVGKGHMILWLAP